MKKVVALIVIITLALSSVFFIKSSKTEQESKFYGTVELNYTDLAFVESERITKLYVNEGDYVKVGDKIGELDSSYLIIKKQEAIATREALKNAYEKLRSGYLPDEIEKAKANARLEKAQAQLAELEYTRQLNIFKDGGISQNYIDRLQTSMVVAKEESTKADIELRIIQRGFRQEDIDQAKANIDAADAKIAMLERQIADSILTSPIDGFVSNKLSEVGELALPQKAVYRISSKSPVWIRGYISEPELGRISLNQQVQIYTDSYLEPIIGKISYISNTAEFTPKTVQTEELRSALVYKVKVLVEDPQYLKQGMPVTVKY